MNECFIRGVVDDNSVICKRVVYPFLELCRSISGTGGVVRGAEVDDIGVNVLVGHCRKSVALVGICEKHLSAAHNVCVNIYRVCGIGDKYGVVRGEDIADIAAVRLRTVAYEHFFCRNFRAVLLVVSRDSFTQEIVAETAVLVTAECLLYAHFLRSLLHRVNDCGNQRERNVADTHSYDLVVGVSGDVLADALADLDKKVALL